MCHFLSILILILSSNSFFSFKSCPVLMVSPFLLKTLRSIIFCVHIIVFQTNFIISYIVPLLSFSSTLCVLYFRKIVFRLSQDIFSILLWCLFCHHYFLFLDYSKSVKSAVCCCISHGFFLHGNFMFHSFRWE